LQLGFYGLLIWGPLGEALLRLARQWGGERYYVVLALFTASIILVFRLVVFPLDFYRSFIYEHQWELSNRPLGLYLTDYLKSRGLELLFTVPGIWILYALIRWRPTDWWVWVAAGYAVWSVISIMLSPVIIDPLFHKFTPLEDEELRQSVVTLAGRAGLEVDEVLVMDASRRTKKVNAYFTGFGGTRRVVLYDNLVDKFAREEVELVLAHELGHWKHQHINKGLIVGTAGSFILFWVVAACLRSFVGQGPLYLSSQSDPGGLPVILLLFVVLFFVVMPVEHAISRHFERQADAAAFELTEKPEVWIELEKRLVTSNMGLVQPHPYIRWLFYTHPSVLERIKAAEQYGS
jgi:STE24 endopeptidase